MTAINCVKCGKYLGELDFVVNPHKWLCKRCRDSDGTATAALCEDIAEEWRSVPDYEGYYEVSNFGQVRSLARVVPSTAHGLRRTVHPRTLKQRSDRDGYPIVTLTKNSIAKLVPVHRLVALAFHGPCPEGRECAHLDGNRANPRFDNLTWASKAENEAHKYLHGTRQARVREDIAQNPSRNRP